MPTLLQRDIRRFVPLGESGQRLESAIATRFDSSRHAEDDMYLPRLVRPFKRKLIDESINTRDTWGVNHRGFWVGAISLLVVAGELRLKKAANHSPEEGILRNCSELETIEQARDWDEQLAAGAGSVALEWLFITGPPYTTRKKNRQLIATSSGIEADTLPPCDECRDVLNASPYVNPGLRVTTIAAPLRGPAMAVRDRRLYEINSQFADVAAPPSSLILTRGALPTPGMPPDMASVAVGQ